MKRHVQLHVLYHARNVRYVSMSSHAHVDRAVCKHVHLVVRVLGKRRDRVVESDNENLMRPPAEEEIIQDLTAHNRHTSTKNTKTNVETLQVLPKQLKEVPGDALLDSVDRKLNVLEQYTRRSSIQIHGIQESPNEDAHAVFIDTLRQLCN